MLAPIATLQFRTDDADEARERLAREFGSHSRVPDARGPIGYELRAVGTRRVMAGTMSARLGSTVRAATVGPTLHVPLDAVGRYRVGRRQIEAATGVGVVLAPGHEYTARVTSGSWLALRIDTALLSEALDERSGRPLRAWGIDSSELPLTTEDRAFVGATIARLREVAAATERPSQASVEALERSVAQWFAERLLAARGVGAVPRNGVRIAERADLWIREHLASQIRLEDVARVAGATERVLQKACIARWGRSPLELVASHRMAAARERLLAAPSNLTVTQAAIECGFNHLGRFAMAYKQAYGESPSETIARRADAGVEPPGRARPKPGYRGAVPDAPIRARSRERVVAA